MTGYRRLLNLSIRTKITAAFMALTLLIAALGVLSILKLSTLNQVVRGLSEDYVTSVDYLVSMEAAITGYRIRLIRALANNGNPASMKELDTAMTASKQKVAEFEAKYVASIGSAEERVLYDGFRENWTAFLRAADGTIALLADQGTAKALESYNQNVVGTAALMGEFLHKDIDLNIGGVKTGVVTAQREFEESRLMVLALVGLCILIACGAGYLLILGIAQPVKGMTVAMRRLAANDIATDIPAQGRTDEVGQMAEAVQVFKDSMVTSSRLAADQERERAAKEQRAVRLSGLIQRFEAKVGSMVSGLPAGSTELEATAQSMSNTAAETTTQTSRASMALEEASSSAQTVAVAAEELSASIAEISRQVAQSSRITGKAVSDSRHADEIVRSLAAGAEKIGQVIGLITNIAGQTNLLALNATIEAARAGEAGKGFAVVASEVKGLATQTGKATEEIGRLIEQIQSATRETVAAIQDITATVEEVNVIAAAIASAVEEQGAATAEIARNVQQTAEAAHEVTSNVGSVSQSALHTGTSAEQVLISARDLSRQAEELSLEVNEFVTGVRAA